MATNHGFGVWIPNSQRIAVNYSEEGNLQNAEDSQVVYVRSGYPAAIVVATHYEGGQPYRCYCE